MIRLAFLLKLDFVLEYIIISAMTQRQNHGLEHSGLGFNRRQGRYFEFLPGTENRIDIGAEPQPLIYSPRYLLTYSMAQQPLKSFVQPLMRVSLSEFNFCHTYFLLETE